MYIHIRISHFNQIMNHAKQTQTNNKTRPAQVLNLTSIRQMPPPSNPQTPLLNYLLVHISEPNDMCTGSYIFWKYNIETGTNEEKIN